MAKSDVYFKTTDGNIGRETSTENVDGFSGLLFDISAQSDIWTSEAGKALKTQLEGTVLSFSTLSEYNAWVKENELFESFMNGIPAYHINHYFTESGTIAFDGVLYVAFADCSKNFDALITIQRASVGRITQFGIFTEQNLWEEAEDGGDYKLNLAKDIQTTMVEMDEEYHSCAVAVLNANVAKIKTATGTSNVVDITKIPSCKVGANFVSILLGQDDAQATVQAKLDSTTPVGLVGCALNRMVELGVAENIGYAADANSIEDFISGDIEFGFGDSTVKDGKLTNSSHYDAVANANTDALVDKGYIIVQKRYGKPNGIWFSGDTTCALDTSDFRRIALNRVINKSRRQVRIALLEYVNAKVAVDPSTGYMSAGARTTFSGAVNDVLTQMKSDEEIVAIGSITVPEKQNVLQNDKVQLSYSIIPFGNSGKIDVTDSLSLSQS
jgi:hypothetical protein